MSLVDALALGWETRTWEPRSAMATMSRAAAARKGTPYQAAVPPRIATMRFFFGDAVLAAAEDARAEVTRFDAELSAMFGGEEEFAPLATVLLRTESSSSSQIENITAGARALALAEIGLARHGSNAELVAANVEAMQRAVAEADRLTPSSLLAIHAALMHDQPSADPGVFRTEPVWIGGSGAYPHGAQFVPPHHERLPAGIEDLCAFLERTDLPLVAHAAVAHAQFETIHPFVDGNGRTGRALVHAMLRHGRATTRTTVPVSAGLLTDSQHLFHGADGIPRRRPRPHRHPVQRGDLRRHRQQPGPRRNPQGDGRALACHADRARRLGGVAHPADPAGPAGRDLPPGAAAHRRLPTRRRPSAAPAQRGRHPHLEERARRRASS